MKTESLTFRDACDRLQPKTASSQPAAKLSEQADDWMLMNRVVGHYHETLKHNTAAQAYLKRRGLDDPQLIETFKIGFSNRSLSKVMPDSRRKSQPLRDRLKTLGVFKDNGMEQMQGCVVVPLFDEYGNVAQLYGRKVSAPSTVQTPSHMYLPKPQRGVFNRDALGQETLIVCESILDAMSIWMQGYRNVTTSFGVNGTAALVEAIQASAVQKIYIAYDRDDAGNKGAAALAELLRDRICYRIHFPQGMDANEYYVQNRQAIKAFKYLVDQAQPIAGTRLEEYVDTRTGEIHAASESAKKTLERQGEDYHIEYQSRQYRVRNFNPEHNGQLKINLLVRQGEKLHVDNLDLYQSKARHHFIQQASQELDQDRAAIKADLVKLLIALEQVQHEPEQEKPVTLSAAETEQALALLKDPTLMQRIQQDFDALGLVGEQTNKLVGYLAAVSRKCDKPLAIIIQSSSAAGKSSLMDLILTLMPEEERIQYTAMTGQSLFYMGETNLKHKILAIAEEEGAEQASYALKLLQSEGQISIASTGKDAKTGQLMTRTYRVEGPVMLFMTTTAIDIDPELMNRCLTLSVNESRDQTRAIHHHQRLEETLEGLFVKSRRQEIIDQHRNAQRLLKPVNVVNPYATQLTFVDDQTRTRRDHKKYLGLIRSIALLHQYQRPVKTHTQAGETKSYIEVTLEDIRWANQLAHEVLGRTLDELPPQTRKLLHQIHEWVEQQLENYQIKRSEFRFTRKQIRSVTHWGHTQLKVHLDRLEEMEYVLSYCSAKGGRSLEYELLYQGEGQNDAPFLMGLIDVQALNST